jgi:hypothetical protein
MFAALARALAGLSLALRQPLESFCELETAHGDALVTRTGHYYLCTVIMTLSKCRDKRAPA